MHLACWPHQRWCILLPTCLLPLSLISLNMQRIGDERERKTRNRIRSWNRYFERIKYENYLDNGVGNGGESLFADSNELIYLYLYVWNFYLCRDFINSFESVLRLNSIRRISSYQNLSCDGFDFSFPKKKIPFCESNQYRYQWFGLKTIL